MAVHERKRFATVFHAIVAVLILIAGGFLLAVGIWLRVSNNGGLVDLDLSGNNFLRHAFTASIGSIVIGGFLIITAIFGLFAIAQNCLGATFRILYVLLSLVIIAALVFTCVVSSLALSEDDSAEVREVLSDAWTRTALDPQGKDRICKIEADLECRGFFDNDCRSCPLGTEAACRSFPNCVACARPSDPTIGCYDEIISRLRKVFLPIAITSGILSFVVFLDIIAACSL